MSAINEPPVKDASKESEAKPIEELLEEPIVAIETQQEQQEQPKTKEVLLRLGDVILIEDPVNDVLNNNVFLIDYIDKTKIKLINSESFEKTVLTISPEGVIGDGSITSIKILSSNEKLGYALQNDLLPGTWINIYFGGEYPTVITGKITNLEEDMIEIKTLDDDTLYINFAYQGIPEELPIETFEIRPAPSSLKEREPVEISAEELVDIGEEKEEKAAEEAIKVIPTKQVRENIQKLLFDATDIEFGDMLEVQEVINVDKEKQRFSLDAQASDLLEEMISGIPNHKRTNSVLNSIHVMISRFIQLRKSASTLDKNGNVQGFVKRTAEDRPLAEVLSDFKNNLYWINLVATNIKKVYPDTWSKEASTAQESFGINGDVDVIHLNQNLLSMHQLFANYRSNVSIEGQNKYINLYKMLDPSMTPFESVDVAETEDVFNSNRGIIIEHSVESDINAIIDNLGEFYSTIVTNNQRSTRRYVTQKYNMGLDCLHADNLKGSKMIAHRVKLTNNDSISVKGLLTLPEPAVRFSQINLPGTDLLVRSNLNLHFLNYWQILKKDVYATNIIIDGLDNEIEYTGDNFVDNIKSYMLDLSEFNKPAELTNLDIYKIFLRTIIPKIRVLFSLVKKYIRGRLSLVDVVNFLEPFLVYPVDLTYNQYVEINNFIKEKIREHNVKFKEYSHAFSIIRNLRVASAYGKKGAATDVYYFKNPLYNAFNPEVTSKDLSELGKQIFSDYGFEDNKQMKIGPSEFLKRVTVDDYGNLYNTAVALTNVDLMFPSELATVFEYDKDRIQSIMEKDKQGDKCNSYVIAKKYYEKDKLLEDNNKTIYFDKAFDNTNYDLLDEKYKKEKNTLTAEELILFLTDDLQKKAKLTEEDAEYMAETLVNQAKKVREGNYAMLSISLFGIEPEGIEYYKRQNDTWVLEKDIDPKWFMKEDDVLCNIDYKCAFNTTTKDSAVACESTEVTKDTIVANALKQILDQFDKSYNVSKSQLNAKIGNHLAYYGMIYGRLQELKRKQFLKDNNQKYELGLTVSEELKNIVVSPYAKLRDLIVGQNDFVKKQTDIIQFVKLYCRPGEPELPNINDGEMESKWWYYCKETNVKLLPAFRYILANTFITANDKYDDVLNELIKQIGKQSDDGDSWVDENSGEVICYIDFDVSEGYKDGFVDKSRDIMEKDAGQTILEEREAKKEKGKEKAEKRLSPEGQIASNVVSTLSINMGIDIEGSRDFIIGIVSELMNDVRVIEKESAYKVREQEAAKRGKKLPEYIKVYSSTLMYLILGAYLVAVQTSIPPIKTKKTFPGCVRSFSGFPLDGEGDDTGLNYLACVALKNRDPSTMPWNSLPKQEDKIAATMKVFIVRYLMPDQSVEKRMRDKIEYLVTNPEPVVPEEHSVSKWTNFLPPLRRFHVKQLNNVSESFYDELQREISLGSPKSLEKLLVVESKIIAFSLGIQECIQKLVEKKDVLLKNAGQPFVDNACCTEKGTDPTIPLQYFNADNNNIDTYNQVVASLTGLCHDIKILTESAIMLSEVDTKRNFPDIPTDFSEETIYNAFIKFCHFQTSLPLSEELASICIDKPDFLKKMDPIQEKISKLKRDGRNYTKEQFLRLFQIVSRNNIINLSLNYGTVSCVQTMRSLLDELDTTDDQSVSRALTQKLEGLIDSYDVSLEEDTKEMRDLKNYLDTSNGLMRKTILDFIGTKGKLRGSNELKKITKFLNSLTVWRYDENPRKVGAAISDDGLYNGIQFIKNFISLFAVVFPSMIVNQKVQSINPPSYWGVSASHKDDIIAMVSEFYKPLDNFYGNHTINNVLYEIKSKCRGILRLSEVTPAFTNIKIGEKEVWSVFERRVVLLLFEHYFLSVLSDYISLTQDPAMVTRMLTNPEKAQTDLFSADFLIEQQLRFSEEEQDFIQGDVATLKTDIARLIISYLTIMMNAKKTVDVSYDDIQDRVFRLKEAEKYSFTDRLRDMTQEERAVDTILKHHKLGPLYSIGLSKGIKEYDPENFDHDKRVAEEVTKIQNKLRRQNRDMDVDEAFEQAQTDYEIARDVAMEMNVTDDYDDGDPWGDELDADNRDDYN
jgi:hypothetical protein